VRTLAYIAKCITRTVNKINSSMQHLCNYAALQQLYFQLFDSSDMKWHIKKYECTIDQELAYAIA